MRIYPHRNCRGQALIEFVFMALMLLVMIFGLIDFGRAIYTRQIMTSLSREGANLASRGTSLSNTLSALNVSAAPLNLTNNGYVVLSAIRNSGTATTVIEQVKGGGVTKPSRIAPAGVNSVPTLPTPPPGFPLPQPNQTMYAAEIFYRYEPVTPIGNLLSMTLPDSLYDAAFF